MRPPVDAFDWRSAARWNNENNGRTALQLQQTFVFIKFCSVIISPAPSAAAAFVALGVPLVRSPRDNKGS